MTIKTKRAVLSDIPTIKSASKSVDKTVGSCYNMLVTRREQAT